MNSRTNLKLDLVPIMQTINLKDDLLPDLQTKCNIFKQEFELLRKIKEADSIGSFFTKTKTITEDFFNIEENLQFFIDYITLRKNIYNREDQFRVRIILNSEGEIRKNHCIKLIMNFIRNTLFEEMLYKHS